MGCDINMVVQKQGDDGKWSDIGKIEYVEEPKWERREVGVKVYDDRNYDVFGVLANVRNGTWGEETPFISEPRGLPDDCGYDEDSGVLGDHSFTWLTVAEVLAFDWDHKIQHDAFMDLPTYRKWRKDGGEPASYCAGMTGRKLTMAEADAMSGDGPRGVDRYVVNAQWSTPIRLHAKAFLEWVNGLAQHGEPDKIRLVFGFDS